MMKKYIQLIYLPFIINEKFINNKKNNIKLANIFRLSSLFHKFKNYRFKDNKIILKYFF